MIALVRRLRARLKYRHWERELAREIETHRAMKQDDLEASGLPLETARTTSVRELGNTTQAREEARAVWIATWLEHVWQDLRFAARGVRRQPGFSVAVILLLALGVASLTTSYSTMNATLLRAWQVPDPEAVVLVRARPAAADRPGSLSIDEIQFLDTHARTLTGLATFIRAGGSIDGVGASVQSKFVTSNYFDVVGARLARGPGFTRGRDHVPATREAVISDRLWRGHFAGDAAIIGRVLRFPTDSYTIVGVAEPGFDDVDNVRIGVWMSMDALNFGDARTGGMAVGRLAHGTSRDQAVAEIDVLSRRFRDANGIPAAGLTVTDTRPISAGRPGVIRQFSLVFAGLALILLLTCANVSSLLLARAVARQREVAVRLSLGASRGRVARQFLTETLVLALAAGTIGLVMAAIWPRIVMAISGSTYLRPEYLAPDWSVALFAAGTSVVAAALAGASAAWRVGHMRVAHVTKRSHGPDLESRRARSVLVAVQIAITALLLTGAGLVGRSVVAAGTADPGFAADGLSVVSFEFAESVPAPRRQAFRRALMQETSVAGRQDVAFAAFKPLIRGASTILRLCLPDEHQTLARHITHRPVSPAYFSLLRIPILKGRAPAPGSGGSEVMLSEMAARSFWTDGGAVGRTLLRLGGKEPASVTVVGIARDVPVRSLGMIEPIVYSHSSDLPLALVATNEPAAMLFLTQVTASIEPTAKLTATPVRQIVRESFSEAEAASHVGWLVGAGALFISTIGIFGVFTYSVEERRREIGIRLALGGRARDVWSAVAHSAYRATMAGVAAGFGACVVAAFILRHQVYGLAPLDAMAYMQSAAIIGAATVVALWIPARRAMRVDPVLSLRAD